MASACLIQRYVKQKKEYMFWCKECRLQIHYECTCLHAYQLHQFTQKGYHKYICDNCTVGIPNDIKEHSCDNVDRSCVSAQWSNDKSNDELQICLNESTNIKDQNHVIKQNIEELGKRQELLRKLIKDQETTVKIKNENAKRRDSQTENIN